jgi:hypothetical protein
MFPIINLEKDQTISQRKLRNQTSTHQTSTNRYRTTPQLQITIRCQHQTINRHQRHLLKIINTTRKHRKLTTTHHQQTSSTSHNTTYHHHRINRRNRSPQTRYLRLRYSTTRLLQKPKIINFGRKQNRGSRSYSHIQ